MTTRTFQGMVIMAAVLALGACATATVVPVGNTRAPIDPSQVRIYAQPPDVDIQYVLTGFHFGEVPGAEEARDAYASGVTFIANLFVAHKLHRDDALMNAIASVDACAEHSARVRGALSNVATALQGWAPKRSQTRSTRK